MKKIFSLMLVLSLCSTAVFAQKSKEKISVKVNTELKPDVYIDGKKYDSAIVDLLDPDKIARMDVVKGKSAMEKYNAPNGVILITTKKNSTADFDGQVKIRVKGNSSEEPLILIDGKESNQETLKKLSPDDIESINIIKGENAIKQYNAPNGVVQVKTKKR